MCLHNEIIDGVCMQCGHTFDPPVTGVMQAPVATNLDPDTEGI